MAYLMSRSAMGDFYEMNHGFYKLRQNRSHEEFVNRRAAYERKWFRSGYLPRWYKTIYRTVSEMLMD